MESKAMRSLQHKPSIVLATSILCIAACGNDEGQSIGQDPNIPVVLNPKNNTPQGSGQGLPTSEEKDLVAPPPDSPNRGETSSPVPQEPNPPQTPDSPAQPTGSTVTVEVNGIRNVKGNVCLSMFNSPDGYPNSASKAVLARCFTVVSNSFEIQIEGVVDGVYAIALWHDENRDEKLNYNFLGIPKEGLAFSENGKPRITPPPPGPPSFNSISFEVKGEPRRTSTKMTYLLDFL
jgi:uncharacterized protein (DUF2141 family)